MKSDTNQVVVVGGGLGGLASACTLAARGHSVVLFERNPWLGGKAAQLRTEGFRFDMGPTILTMPSVLRRIFAEANRRLEDYLELVRLDPQWRCIFEDGSTLDLREDVGQMARDLDQFAPGSDSGRRYLDFLEVSKRLNRISQQHFFYKPIGGLRDIFDFKRSFDPHLAGDLLAMRPGRSVASTVRAFTSDARIAQMMDHFTQYVGSSPYGSPAVLCGIAHMQTDEGIWYPMGGTRSVPLALERVARELGVQIRAGTEVTRILDQNGTVCGVETKGGATLPCRAVVSNCDSVRTHRELVNDPASAQFARRRRYEPACSGVVLYLGLKQRYDHLAHHNFVFSRDPLEEFKSIYQKGEPALDPTCYLAATSQTEPGTAPENGEALYVLVHTPYLRPHHDWAKMLPRYREVILNKLKTTGQMADIESRIVFEQTLTPQDINDRYHVLNGAIYGLASHGKFLGAFKPNNRSPDLKRLYLAGGAAHPGPGMPMVLMSGWIAADALDRDLGQRKPEKGSLSYTEPELIAG
ncbi:MAG TPA: phytoene desaturase family protein [Verrucomicrobiae bacterium]|nr:phytoene desaturase family protein [Verrucomicrobiae bacterium]